MQIDKTGLHESTRGCAKEVEGVDLLPEGTRAGLWGCGLGISSQRSPAFENLLGREQMDA